MDGILGYLSTNKGKFQIGEVDSEFFARKIGLNRFSPESFIEGYVNDLFTASTRMLEDPMSCGNKAYNSDGFHISKYFTVLTEHKKGRLTSLKLRYALEQAIFYYWESVNRRGDLPDKLRYIVICDNNNVYAVKIKDIAEEVKKVFEVLDQLRENGCIGHKNGFTASNIYKCNLVDFILATSNILTKVKEYSYSRFSECMLWMFNEWEEDYPTELETITKLS